MTLSPVTQTVKRDTEVPLTVTIDTKGRAVATYQFVLTFEDARLDCSRIEVDRAAWPTVAAVSCNGSEAKFAAYGTAPFTGTAVAATVYLKTSKRSGNALVGFAPDGAVGGGTMIVGTEPVNILGPTNTATLRVR